jgi:hypothetical protein
MMQATDSEISEVLILLRAISERPRCNRVRMVAVVAIAWAMGALMGMGI